MDLGYIAEVFTYGYLRNSYRDYEDPWNKDYFKCSNKKPAETRRNTQQQSKENCYFCKEMKRRNLGVYIRSKSRSDSCQEGIHEEEEESDTTHGEKKTADASQNKSAKSYNTEKQKS